MGTCAFILLLDGHDESPRENACGPGLAVQRAVESNIILYHKNSEDFCQLIRMRFSNLI